MKQSTTKYDSIIIVIIVGLTIVSCLAYFDIRHEHKVQDFRNNICKSYGLGDEFESDSYNPAYANCCTYNDNIELINGSWKRNNSVVCKALPYNKTNWEMKE